MIIRPGRERAESAHWTGNPAGLLACPSAPPISLLVLPKEKRAVHGPKRKNASAGRSAHALTSCRRRGMAGMSLAAVRDGNALPLGSTVGTGRSGIHPAPFSASPLALLLRVENEWRRYVMDLPILRGRDGERRSPGRTAVMLLAAKASESRTAGLFTAEGGNHQQTGDLYSAHRLPPTAAPSAGRSFSTTELPGPGYVHCLCPELPGERQRKEKQFIIRPCTPLTGPHHLARDGSCKLRRRPIACPKARQNRRLHRYADPAAARRATAPERAPAAFFSSTGRGAFSFWARPKREWGAHPPDVDIAAFPGGDGRPPSHPLHFPIIFQIKEGTQSWIRF